LRKVVRDLWDEFLISIEVPLDPVPEEEGGMNGREGSICVA
jgi:hypothetical protein